MKAWWVDLGRMEYGAAWELQRQVHALVRDGAAPDTVLLVEHPPVYTIGRGARGSRANVLWSDAERERHGIALYEVDRGGDVTYHGPGQQVGYPILRLERHGRDLLVYLRALEEAFIQLLLEFGIRAERIPPHTGVWVGTDKIVAIGVKASQGVTMHGFAFNVDPDLGHFAGIIPCGIRGKGVTSLAALLGRPVTLEAVRPLVLKHLGAVLGLEWEPVDLLRVRELVPSAS
jgi:lipoyl(octanoyl) transferase